MADLGQAYVQIIPKAEGISGAITNALSPEAKSAGEKSGKEAGSSFGSSIKNTLVKLGIGAVVTKGLKAAFSEGAALQQSLGGVETLFAKQSFDEFAAQAKEAGMGIRQIREEYEKMTPASDIVIANANKAYKTAGLSANEYMETVTSFSASLLQSLGGDTEKAASVADMALIDMADNANKFGTDMGSIQTAYQGFAKQNYTMLDNLKLGYGGTKEEMNRLLEDASKLSGVEYDISNLSDVYNAIHVIQDNLGVTGTTAKEAASTFSGSFASMTAAAKNFAANLTTGGDVAGALSELIDSAITFVGGNVIPMLGNLLSSLPGALSTVLAQYAPQAGEAFMGFIQQALDYIPAALTGLTDLIVGAFDALDGSGLLGKGFELIGMLVQGIFNAIPTLLSSVGTILGRAAEFITSNLPEFMRKGVELLINIREGIMSALPEMAVAAQGMVINLLATIGEHLPEILQTGIELAGQLIAGVLNKLPELPGIFMDMCSRIGQIWAAVDWAKLGRDILTGIINGIKAFTGSVGPAVKNVVSAIDKQFNFSATISKVSNAFNNIKNKISNAINSAKATVTSAISRIKGAFNFSWSLPHLKLPHISVSGGTPPYGIGGAGSLPHFSISWYKKAEQNPYLFTDATLFGAGESKDEVLYGKSALMRDITAAVNKGNSGTTVTNYITVNGAEDPEAWAQKFARQMKMELRMA